MPVLTMDLHTHLLEKNIKPADYWKAVMRRKLDAVALTEHANLEPEKAYRDALEIKPKGVVLIPAMELNTDIGHVLAYGNESIFELTELQKKVSVKRAVKIADEENILLSIAHPYGFKKDSAVLVAGIRKIEKLLEGGSLGVEIYNGMIGHLSNFIYDTNWVRKTVNFFDFIEKNRVARKTKFDKIGKKFRSKIDKKSGEMIEKCRKTIELGEKAGFITAGSDAHYPDRIGAGILRVKTSARNITVESILKEVKERDNVVWFGPYVREVSKGVYERVDDFPRSLTKKEVFGGLKYAGKKVLVEKTRIKKIGKKILEIDKE